MPNKKLAGEVISRLTKETNGFAGMLVEIESVLLGSMIVLNQMHKMKPEVSTQLIEETVSRATERFVAYQNMKGK